MDHSLPGSSVRGILQARTLEWVATPSSRGSSRPRDWTPASRLLRWQVGSLPLVPPRKPHPLPRSQQTTNKNLLYTTGSASQYPRMAYMQEDSKQRGDVCVCVTDRLYLRLKPVQHCRSTIRRQKFKHKTEEKSKGADNAWTPECGWKLFWNINLKNHIVRFLSGDSSLSRCLLKQNDRHMSILVGANSCIIRALIVLRRSEGLFWPPGKSWCLGTPAVTAAEGLPGMPLNIPPGTGQPPMTKESQAPDTNRAEAEKSCLRDFTAYRS